eukprot:643638-Hanusia_phi.AAC.1
MMMVVVVVVVVVMMMMMMMMIDVLSPNTTSAIKDIKTKLRQLGVAEEKISECVEKRVGGCGGRERGAGGGEEETASDTHRRISWRCWIRRPGGWQEK